MVHRSSSLERDSLILVHAPTGRDAKLLDELLQRARLHTQVCPSMEALCEEVERGTGAVFITEEALDPTAIERLSNILHHQSSWSDLPLVVLTVRGEPTDVGRERLNELKQLGDLTLLERPLRSDTIVSAARSALRARAKQYDVRRRDAELQLVTDNVPVLIAYVDSAQVYRRVNQTYFEWLGKRPEEIVGRTVRSLVGEASYSRAEPYIRRALEGERVSFESQFRDKDQQVREINVSYAPDTAPDETVRGFIAFVQDITDRKRFERRQTLLLNLLEHQRKTSDPDAMMRAAADAVGRHLSADRTGFFEMRDEEMQFTAGWTAGRLPLLTTPLPAHAIGTRYLEQVRAGKTLGISDARVDPLTADSWFGEIGTVSLIGAPIIRGGHWSAGLYINHAEPRRWRDDEVAFVREVADQTWDAVERARALTALRASEARFRFLAELDDATRSLTDSDEITHTAARLLGQHLNADRCAYAHVEGDEDTFHITGDYNRGVPSIVGRYTMTEFGKERLRLMREGLPFVVEDTERDPRTEGVRDAYRAALIRSMLCVSLRKMGRFVSVMAVHQTVPRQWRPDEVELVQQVANRCWESIERTRVTGELREREQRFRFLAESIPQMVWTATPDGVIEYVNGQGTAYFGVEQEALLGRGWLTTVHPEDQQLTLERFTHSAETGEPYDTLCRLRRGSDGSWRWHLVRALPLIADDGAIAQWFGTCTDIEDQKATEAQLKRMNQELEEFAYVSSHDLQEPLRMVNSYSQLLLRRLGPQATKDFEQYVEYIRTGVKRMEALIRDLLSYSQAVHPQTPAETGRADLQAALRQAMIRIETSLQESRAELTADALPVVAGDEGQLSHVFQNLLSNAVKYRKPEQPLRIHIGTQRVDGTCVVSVKDNGIGFDQSHSERIFGLFKRLHRQEEYPGTGLGLAICRRILERYQGRIWAESQSGAGSTFFFALPEPPHE